MYDRGLSVLEQYGLNVKSSYRGRGALLCQTQIGLVMIREFAGSVKKLQKQWELLRRLEESCPYPVDQILANQEGALVSVDKEGISYVVRKWCEGRECDTRSREDILKGVAALGAVHKCMHMEPDADYFQTSLVEEYEKHNRELRKIRKFIRTKRRQNPFEQCYLESVQWFLERGEEALARLRASGYEKLRREALSRGDVCHGEFNQHNVLLWNERPVITNFDKFHYDVQVADLYCFMRKILEKNAWSQELAKEMIECYGQAYEMTDSQYENLKIRFLYPEKYWKLANYYYNHNKAWVSEKNIEKITKLISAKNAWHDLGNGL